MVCGMPHLDFKALREAAKYEGFTPDSTVVQWLWEIVERMDLAEKRRFLKFFSGALRGRTAACSRFFGPCRQRVWRLTRMARL